MIEETTRVVATEGEYALLEVEPRSACGQCSAGGHCGTSVLLRWFGRRGRQFRIRNHPGLKAGERAVIGISESDLMGASFLAYLLPIVAMVFTALMGAVWGLGDGVVALCSLCGLGAGLYASNRIVRCASLRFFFFVKDEG